MRVLLLAALAALLPCAVSAQGLGDTAARERDRRTRTEAPTSAVFTNDDLASVSEAPTDSEEALDGEVSSEEEETPAPGAVPVDPLREELDREREKRARQEREWRARFAEARARYHEAEARCWRDVVRTEFHKGIPVQMKVKEFVETEELRQTKQALADLQEEFRRTGLPPGWARE